MVVFFKMRFIVLQHIYVFICNVLSHCQLFFLSLFFFLVSYLSCIVCLFFFLLNAMLSKWGSVMFFKHIIEFFV
jgi:hypothetical protein